MFEERYRNARLLVIDDEFAITDSLKRILRSGGFQGIRSTNDPRQAVPLYEEFHPDLMILDLHMPNLSGTDVLEQMRSRAPVDGYFPVLVLTGDGSAESKQGALSLGAKDFLVKPCDPTELCLRVRNLLETRFLYLELQANNHVLEAAVQTRTRELEQAQAELAARLGRAAEYRDDATGQHAARVGRLAGLIAQNLGLSDEQSAVIAQAAPLHDVGKIGVPDAIRLKSRDLSPDETALLQTHTTIGAQILSGSGCAVLRVAESIALYHHERWDGSGYAQIKGANIPLAARITAVADAFDGMTHVGRGKGEISIPAAQQAIARDRGSRFDPQVVDAFLRTTPAALALDLGIVHARELRPKNGLPVGDGLPAHVRSLLD